MRNLLIAFLAVMCFTATASAQRQTTLYIDNGSGGFTALTAPSGPGSLVLPSSGTLLTTTNTNTITSLGTIGTGTWQGTVIGPTYGGTGVNNGSNTLTISGGNITLTSANPSSVTVPASGTLATTSQLPATQGMAVAWGSVNADGSYARSYGMSGTVTHTAGSGSYTLTLANSLQSAGANAIIIATPVVAAGETYDATVNPGYPTNGTSFFVYTGYSNASGQNDQAFNFVVYDHP